MRRSTFAVALGLMLVPTVAQAQQASSQPAAAHAEAETKPAARWYGWQTLIVDAAAVSGFAGGSLLLEPQPQVAASILVPSAVLYALGGPTVHVLHGRVGTGLGSFGLRVAMPVLGALAAGEAACSEQFCSAFLVGAYAGAALAMAVDATLLAREPRRDSRVSILPSATLTKDGGRLGLGGTF